MAKFLKLKNGDLINHECVDKLCSEMKFGSRVYTLYYCHGLQEEISKEEFENFQKELLDNEIKVNKKFMKTGIELIQEERQKQIDKYKYTPEHDSVYKNKELLQAALTYGFCALKDGKFGCLPEGILYPFGTKFKDEGYIENLKKVGAFVAAEIDRYQFKDKLNDEK